MFLISYNNFQNNKKEEKHESNSRNQEKFWSVNIPNKVHFTIPKYDDLFSHVISIIALTLSKYLFIFEK